jgi:hypothetical protein
MIHLKHVHILTIFGHGAPHTDVEAIELMRDAPGPVRGVLASQDSGDGHGYYCRITICVKKDTEGGFA